MSVFDVSRVALRRRGVWRGGVALKFTVCLLGWAVAGELWSGPVPTALWLAVWPLLVVVVYVLVRPLRSGQLLAARAVAVLAVAVGVLQLALLARFVGRLGGVSSFTAPVVAAMAWSVRALAGGARAVVGSPTTRLDTALLRVAIPVLGAGAVVIIAAAAITHADLLGRITSEPAGVQWSVLLLALAGYLNVRTIADALSPGPEPDGSNRIRELLHTWELPSRRTRLMYGTVGGTAFGCFSLAAVVGSCWVVFYLLIKWEVGPSGLPLLIVVAWLIWRWVSMFVRAAGRQQLEFRSTYSLGFPELRRPDVLYLRSFPTDRWRVRADAIRHPAGKYGRPPLEEALLERFWQYGTVIAAQQPGLLGDQAGPIGAWRSELAPESWHITVVQWMRDASLIVIVAGGSSGLLWELEQLDRLGMQDKLFIVVPPVQRRTWWRRRGGGVQEITQHWKAVGQAVAQVGGMSVPSTIDVERTRAVVPGVGDDDVHVIVSDGDRDFDYEAAVELAATISLARQRRRSPRGTPSDREPPPAPSTASAGQRARAELPADLRTAMADPRPATRQGAVPRLYSLAFSATPAVRAAAYQALERLGEDPNDLVMIQARRLLAELRPSAPPPPPPLVNPPPALPGGPVRQPLWQSRLWYWMAGAAMVGSLVWPLLTFVRSIKSIEEPQRVPIPGQAELRFGKPGSYDLYFEGAGATDQAAPPPAIRVSLTRVGGSDDIPIRPSEGFSTRSVGGHSGRAIGTFQIDKPGRFLLKAAGEPQALPASVAVDRYNPDIWSFVLSLIGAAVLFMVGLTLGFIGLLVRGGAGRMRPSPAREPPTWKRGAIPGWYVDVGGRHELRYWDGQRWTEHVFDHGTQAVDP